MRKIFFLGILFFCCVSIDSFAQNENFNDSVQQGKILGESSTNTPVNGAKVFNPNAVFNYYTGTPTQTQYYQGVQQQNTQNLQNDSAKLKSNADNPITQSINQRPSFVIQGSNPDIEKSNAIQNEAYNILQGVTNRYTDCKEKMSCVPRYENKTCLESPKALFQTCQKKLKVTVTDHDNISYHYFNLTIKIKDRSRVSVNINSVTGQVTYQSPQISLVNLTGRMPPTVACSTLIGREVGHSGDAVLKEVHYPSCANQLSFSFTFEGGHDAEIKFLVASNNKTYEAQDEWIDECQALSSDPNCKLSSSQCDEVGSTKNINGAEVARDCWQQAIKYMCRGGNGVGNCEALKTCEQIDSNCIEEKNNQCVQYQQTYRCLQNNCTQTGMVTCGDGKDYCINGDCTDKTYAKSEDFATAIASLSAMKEAGKQLDPNNLSIFTGKAVKCSEKPIGFSNCCTEKGWGQDLKLKQCTVEEKKLHVARDNKQAIYVGRYCSGQKPFECLEHSKVYCVFSSKIAKIIQEQGRNKQLHLDFGDADNPDCRGLKVEELQRIDLAKIDFQDFIADLTKNMTQPDVSKVTQTIVQHINEAQNK